MKCYLLKLNKEYSVGGGKKASEFLFKNIKTMFEFLDTENIYIGIKKNTFYSYTQNTTRDQVISPAVGTLMYENDFCSVRVFVF